MPKDETGKNSHELDELDRQLLALLQSNSRQSIAELSERVLLSTSACHRRIKSLEEAKIIEGYVANLCRQKLGFSIELFVEVSLSAQTEETLEEFERAVRAIPEVLECHLLGGQYDYLLRVVAADTNDYERIHRTKITRLPGVARIQSALTLRTIKRWSGYPLE